MAANESAMNGNPAREGNGQGSGIVERLEDRWPEMRDQYQELQERASHYDRQARAFFREHPVTSVLAAVGIGYIIGRILPGR